MGPKRDHGLSSWVDIMSLRGIGHRRSRCPFISCPSGFRVRGPGPPPGPQAASGPRGLQRHRPRPRPGPWAQAGDYESPAKLNLKIRAGPAPCLPGPSRAGGTPSKRAAAAAWPRQRRRQPGGRISTVTRRRRAAPVPAVPGRRLQRVRTVRREFYPALPPVRVRAAGADLTGPPT